jgi:hypothetical protein
MSILDIFRTTPAPAAAPAPEATQQPAAPAQPQQSTAPATSGQPTDGAATAPLDQFTKLWETDANSDTSANQSLFGSVDPKKVFEAARTANFAGAINPESLQAIAAGGEGAVKAFQDSMNAVTQAVFAQSTMAATKLVEQGIAKAMSRYDEQLPSLVKRHAAADSLKTENPALSNPAAAPIISAIQAQLAHKFPEATSSQLTQMAKDYLSNFASVVAPAKPAEAPATKPGETDWMNWLGPQ